MEIKDVKVLVCDDSILVRKQFEKVLKDFGCVSIFEAKNGLEAFDSYKENSPDLVFMDIVMPIATGIDGLTNILSYDPKAKVIMASSAGTQANLKKAIEVGAYNFIQKPIEKEDIHKIVLGFIKGGK